MTFRRVYDLAVSNKIDSNAELLCMMSDISSPVNDNIFSEDCFRFQGTMKKVFIDGSRVLKVFDVDNYIENHHLKSFLFSEMMLNDVFGKMYDTQFESVQGINGRRSVVMSQPFKPSACSSDMKTVFDIGSFLHELGFEKVKPKLNDISKYFNARRNNVRLKKFQLEIIFDAFKNGVYVNEDREIAIDDINESNFIIDNGEFFLYDANIFDLSGIGLRRIMKGYCNE